MSEASDRLERYLTETDGAALDDRLAELDELEALATTHAAEDVPLLSVLADRTRYGLVRALVEVDDELAVCELWPLFEVSESAVSHALGDLVEAGLAERRDDGKWRHYEATDRAGQLLAALDATR